MRASPINISFSRQEWKMLWLAIGNGAGNDAIDSLGLTKREKRMLRGAANRIADTAELAGPRL